MPIVIHIWSVGVNIRHINRGGVVTRVGGSQGIGLGVDWSSSSSIGWGSDNSESDSRADEDHGNLKGQVPQVIHLPVFDSESPHSLSHLKPSFVSVLFKPWIGVATSITN